jgi:hypothetical protein
MELAAEVVSLDAYNPLMLIYVQMLTGLIEGRPVSIEEILAMLARGARQHSIACGGRFDHIVAAVRNRPP